jgi:hypothetical protein
MALRLRGGVNEIVGIGLALAIMRISSTPFWLANTGGSTKFAARAVPPPPATAAATPAAPIHRCIEVLCDDCLLNMGVSSCVTRWVRGVDGARGLRPKENGRSRRSNAR